MNIPNFDNLEVAFRSKTDQELKKAKWLFTMMGNSLLVNIGSSISLILLKFRFPFVKSIIKNTVFKYFCGGETLQGCQVEIQKLADNGVGTILDYGGEAKTSEEDFNASRDEILKAIKFAASNQDVPVISMKVTALTKFSLLEKIQSNQTLTPQEKESREKLNERILAIGQAAEDQNVAVFVDAEESWIQDVIDDLVDTMQERHNTSKAIIYNTFQMYRHDRLAFLKKSHQRAIKKGYLLAAKIVRGAYMEKERTRAEELHYPSPIQSNKLATDKDYNKAITYCIENYQTIAFCNASHNADSNLLQVKLMKENNISIDHPHLMFCQLYGMSDHITFNLANEGYNSTKYMPYGQVDEVIPYLIRRAQENTAVSGEMGREFKMITSEIIRRNKK